MSTAILRSLVWLSWRLTLNSLRRGHGRGDLERFSRLGEVIVPALLGVLLIPAAVVLAVAGCVAGVFLARHPDTADTMVILLGSVLTLPVAWVVIRPFGLAAQGRSDTSELLRLLPISLSLLRHLELLRAAMDPTLLLFVPGLLALPVGALLGGRPLLALLALGAGLTTILLLPLVSSLLVLGCQLLLRDRRRAELLALVFLLVISTIGLVPQILTPQRGRPEHSRSTERSSARAPESPAPLPLFLRILPSFQYAETVAAGAQGRWAASSLPFACLLALSCAAYGLSIPLFRLLLETPAGGRARRGIRGSGREADLPLASRPVAAVAMVQLRTMTRTVRGKMVLLFPPLVGILTAFMFSRRGTDIPFFFASTYLAPGFVALTCLANLNVMTCNQFAVGGTGLLLELLLPVDDRTLLRGRTLAGALLCAASLAAGLALLAVVLPSSSLPTTIAIFLAALAVHLSAAPAAALLSALLPRTVDLSRLGRQGQPHPLAALLALAVEAVLALPPAGCIALAVVVLQRSWLAPLLAAVWLLLGGLIARALEPLAERVLAGRRENLALVAAGR